MQIFKSFIFGYSVTVKLLFYTVVQTMYIKIVSSIPYAGNTYGSFWLNVSIVCKYFLCYTIKKHLSILIKFIIIKWI